MRQIASGRREALGPLHERHAGVVKRIAARAVGPAAADEVVQDVFVDIWRHAGKFDASRGSFRSWLLQLTRWRIANELRRRRRRLLGKVDDAEEEIERLTDDAPEPVEQVTLAERRAALRGALEVLPGPQREAVAMAFFDELTHEEVAAALNVPLGTTKTRIRAGLQRMRVHLAPLGATLLLLFSLGALVQRYVATQSELRLQDRALTLATSSDVVPLHLSAAPGWPEAAHGSYRGHAATSVAVLTVSNLPPAPNGGTYVAWSRHGGGFVRLGALSPDASGNARVIAERTELETPPDVVKVTLEPDASAAAPTDAIVLLYSSS